MKKGEKIAYFVGWSIVIAVMTMVFDMAFRICDPLARFFSWVYLVVFTLVMITIGLYILFDKE